MTCGFGVAWRAKVPTSIQNERGQGHGWTTEKGGFCGGVVVKTVAAEGKREIGGVVVHRDGGKSNRE